MRLLEIVKAQKAILQLPHEDRYLQKNVGVPDHATKKSANQLANSWRWPKKEKTANEDQETKRAGQGLL